MQPEKLGINTDLMNRGIGCTQRGVKVSIRIPTVPSAFS